MEKDFDSWNIQKKNFDKKQIYPTVNQREIWWCSVGINVGNEENGKGEFFRRPILVIRKFDKHTCLGVPLTTKVKDTWYYHKITLHGQEQSVIITQIKLLDTRRFTSMLGKVSKNQFDIIRDKIKDII